MTKQDQEPLGVAKVRAVLQQAAADCVPGWNCQDCPSCVLHIMLFSTRQLSGFREGLEKSEFGACEFRFAGCERWVCSLCSPSAP